ncbi:hypothetical protein Q7P37_004194 [Cladosporium fusiforme]
MPVSTFSHASTTLREGVARSDIVSRWNSTRERILLDERRVRDKLIQEMDGTGLYERSDWPMRPPSVSPPADTEGKNMDPRGDWSQGSHHITDVAADMEPEAQWAVGNGIEDEGDERPDPRLSGSGIRDGGRAILLPVQEEDDSRAGQATVLKGQDSGMSLSPSPDAEEFLAGTAIATQQQQQRSEQRDNIDTGDRSSGGSSISGDNDLNLTSSWNTHGSQQASGTGDRSPMEQLQITPDQSYRTSPVPDGNDTTPIAQVRHSSISKSSPPESASRRSSIHGSYGTTQITQNKDRVRYSWQSSQDDEPNRPRINIIKLVSNTATASAGFPQGEAFGFSVSAGGRRIAAYNSARLYILQTAALPVGISQDYALKRRPLAVEVLDDGTLLAILSDRHTVNVYDLSYHRLRRSKTIKLDFPTYCIALAPMGGLLAAAYEGGVEIFSLDPNALPTDRRAVRSQKMDRMTFSQDGSTLLGTTTRINASSSVVINVPVFPASPDGMPTSEELKEAWCSELLHPDNIRNSSHATFMRENKSTCNDRLFAWNGVADTFGLLNTTDLQYGHVDFPVVISPPLSTCGGLGAAIHSCPAVDEHGDTVAMIVNDRTIRLYIVPHKAAGDEVGVEAHSIDHELDEGYGCPFSDARWVYSEASTPAAMNNQTHVQGRLLVTSPGGVVDSRLPEEVVQDVEGGRIILFDFDSQFAGQPGQTFSLTLGKSPPQTLEEPEMDVAHEVALVRRRTVNQSKGGGLSQRPVTLGRAATTFNPARNAMRSASPAIPLRRPNSVLSACSGEAARSLPDLVEGNEATDTGVAMEVPFSNTAPRSQASLQRAASNAQRHRFQALEERVHERMSGESTTAFLALPEYTEEPNAPLPSRFRAMAGLDAPAQPRPRPSVVTKSASNHISGPATAPASTTGGLTAEEAFAAAIAATPPARGANGSAIRNHIPRSLQRAYSNAVGSSLTGPPPRLIGDWENVSPVLPQGHRGFPPSSNGVVHHNDAPPRVSREETWDSITPAASATPATQQNNHFRYSTSLLNPPGHQQPNRSPSPTDQPQSATSALPTQHSRNFSTSRRLPPHIQAFRDAAAASDYGSATIFPTRRPSDHVPHRSAEPASTVPHPVTAWHPPAPSSPAPAPSIPRAIVRSPSSGHARRLSQGSKTAFANTTRAKKLGFFKRKRAGADDLGVYGSGKSFTSKRVVNWMAGKKSQKEGGCLMM